MKVPVARATGRSVAVMGEAADERRPGGSALAFAAADDRPASTPGEDSRGAGRGHDGWNGRGHPDRRAAQVSIRLMIAPRR